VLLLENLRFHYEEEVDDEQFAEKLSSLGDVFVQDAFGVVHREHASTHAITKFLPSVAGLLLENEVRQITRAIKHPKQPMVAIVGGAKIKTKIELLDNLLTIGVDRLIIGGAMANTFLVALEMNVGKSLFDEDEIETARRVIAECRKKDILLVLPLNDSAVSKNMEADAERRVVSTEDVQDDDIILDFGDKSAASVIENLKDAGTVLWNGPLGMMEIPAFKVASEIVARFIVDNKIDSVVGGGDTVELIDELGLVDGFTHVSTGGGASLELMSGTKLPGIESLQDK
jgi:3-phosphoglycerate kinase